MSQWGFEQIRQAVDGQWVIAPVHDTVDTVGTVGFVGVAIDTRALSSGQVFFAFVGQQVDGHRFLESAVDRGASMCIVSDRSKVPDDLSVPVVVVDDMLEAITMMARAWRAKINPIVIAVTGSNGKTTTCRLVDSVCAQSGLSCVSVKSFNNAIGVPITILNTPADARYLVAELGTSSPGEIAARARLVEPDIGVITSIGSAHLEELGDRAGVAHEKCSIVDALDDGAHAIIIGGVDELEAVIAPTAARLTITRIGTDLPIEHVESVGSQTSFTLADQPFVVPMLGRHNAFNAAMAIQVGRFIGLDDGAIQRGLLDVDPPKMRLERIEIASPTQPIVLYNDAYNANPDSMRAALDTFDSIRADSPKLAVLGDMLELGSVSHQEHESIVRRCSQYPTIDRFILVGSCFGRVESAPDRFTQIESADATAIAKLAGQIEPGSTVLLKGSRGIGLDRLVGAISDHHRASTITNTEPEIHP